MSPNSDHICPVATEQNITLGDRSSPVDGGTVVGTVGCKFSNKFMRESGEDIGLYDAEVVDIIRGTGTSTVVILLFLYSLHILSTL